MNYIDLKNLKVAEPLFEFINQEVLPGLDMDQDQLWQNFEQVISDNLAQNQSLLNRRDEIQQMLDDWYRQNDYDQNNLGEYKEYLKDIGYLLEEGEDFQVDVSKVDDEIARIAGPQLVVPINNARFAINAANARWGSLYDGLYGTDMIEHVADEKPGYDPARGEKVFAFCQDWLDRVLPLENASHADVTGYVLSTGDGETTLNIQLKSGSSTSLTDPSQLVAFNQGDVLVLLFKHNELHIELHIDATHAIGQYHPANVKDIVIEAAVTTIQDCEDSVTAVDTEDKVQVYRNWLLLINGELSFAMKKGGKSFTRTLNDDRTYTSCDGSALILPGRSMMLVRNVGLHMETDLVVDQQGQPLPEGLIDALVTVLISKHDLIGNARYGNSRSGSVYIVKPKMHGPDEVAFSCNVFAQIEQAYGLEPDTIKIGIMDEERRTTVNLKECIRQARNRVIFINTGFLDRTGDEIHTSMQAGPFLPKAEIKNARWMGAYENWNVDTGLLCGMNGQGQIGKGMWAIPDQIKQMYDTKLAHPQAGANCAWVPSPTAATIHALHYHQVNVLQTQQELMQRNRANVDDILSVPLLEKGRELSSEEIQHELDNNAQGILGYVVKWIDMGIGCSKVPDINDVGLMEDRATLRISSQHMANWLYHGLCNEDQVIETFKRMAKVVDEQNQTTPGYQPMAPGFDGVAFQAALDLVLTGTLTANGYTESTLQDYRLKAKAAL